MCVWIIRIPSSLFLTGIRVITLNCNCMLSQTSCLSIETLSLLIVYLHVVRTRTLQNLFIFELHKGCLRATYNCIESLSELNNADCYFRSEQAYLDYELCCDSSSHKPMQVWVD